MAKWRYGVIFDAGSSGTRVHVYKWLDSAKARKKASPQELHSLPWLTTDKKWTKKTHPGISTYGEKPELVGPEYLEPLLKHALAVVPRHAVKDTPFFLLATAGVRLLPPRQRSALLARICSYVRSHTAFLLPDCDTHVQVIPGETEGLYGWVAANYLLGGFDSPSAHDHGKGHHTYGFLDMGGASAQIAFAPNATEAEKHADDLKLLRLRTLDGVPAEYRVFVTTWLGFGVHEARRRYIKALFEASASPGARELPDPCLPAGLTATIKGDVVQSKPKEAQGLEPYLVGTGRFDECLRQTYPLLGKDAPCSNQPCLLHGVHVPAVDFDVNHFVGVSEYWHTTHEVFEMAHKDASYDFGRYQTHVKAFCSQGWKTLAEGVRKKKWGAKVDERRVVDACFKASWLINMLHDGIGIPRVGLEIASSNNTKGAVSPSKPQGYLEPFQAIDRVNDVEVSWTLGKMVLYAASQVPPRKASPPHDLPVGFGSNTAGVPPDFQYAGLRPGTAASYGGSNASSSDSDGYGWRDSLVLDTDSPRRIPGFLLLFAIVGIVAFIWCGRERRTRLCRRLLAGFRWPRRPGGGISIGGIGGSGSGKRRKAFNGKPLGILNPSSMYERVLEDGRGRHAASFELSSIDSSDDEERENALAAVAGSSSGGGGGGGGPTNVARSSGWATPQLKIAFDPASGSGYGGYSSYSVDAAGGSGTSYFDHVPAAGAAASAAHSAGLGIGLGTPQLLQVGNPMSRSGLFVRADSRDRLAGSGHMSGRHSRTDSPVRLKSPLMTPISDLYD